MDLTALTENVFFYPHESARDRPTLGYIAGNTFGIAVDAGASAAHVGEFYDALTSHGLPLPEFTVLTHWHWDHTFGMHACQGKTVTHKNTIAHLERMRTWSWSPTAISERLLTGEDTSFKDDEFQAEYPDPEAITIALPDLCFTDTLSFNFGWTECLVEHIPSPHSDDSSAVVLQKEGIAFIGDATSPDYFNNNACDRNRFASFMVWLESLSCETVLLGHCEPLSKNDLLDYLRTL